MPSSPINTSLGHRLSPRRLDASKFVVWIWRRFCLEGIIPVSKWLIGPWLISPLVDRVLRTPSKWPFPKWPYKWGWLLTTYDTWNDAPSVYLVFRWRAAYHFGICHKNSLLHFNKLPFLYHGKLKTGSSKMNYIPLKSTNFLTSSFLWEEKCTLPLKTNRHRPWKLKAGPQKDIASATNHWRLQG